MFDDSAFRVDCGRVMKYIWILKTEMSTGAVLWHMKGSSSASAPQFGGFQTPPQDPPGHAVTK